MKFTVFNEVLDNFSSGNTNSFSQFVKEKFDYCCDFLDNYDSNDNDSDLLFESLCFSSFVKYMLVYGDRHTDGPAPLKSDSVLLASASMDMYDIRKKTSPDEYKFYYDILLEKWKSSNEDVEKAINNVYLHCYSSDINPLYLLLFYQVYLGSLEKLNNDNNSREEPLKIKNNNKKKTTSKDNSKNKKEEKKDPPKVNKHKGYYIYTSILIIYILLLYLFSPNSLEVCVGLGFGVDCLAHFILLLKKMDDGFKDKWFESVMMLIAPFYLFVIISTLLITHTFNPTLALMAFFVCRIWSIIKIY